MQPRIVLIIGAVAAAIFGSLLLLMPANMLTGFGMTGQPEAMVLSRDIAVMLLGVAILNAFGRNATGVGLRAILAGNLAIQAFELALKGIEILLGQLSPAAAASLVIHLALGAMFLSALRRSEVEPARSEPVDGGR